MFRPPYSEIVAHIHSLLDNSSVNYLEKILCEVTKSSFRESSAGRVLETYLIQRKLKRPVSNTGIKVFQYLYLRQKVILDTNEIWRVQKVEFQIQKLEIWMEIV